MNKIAVYFLILGLSTGIFNLSKGAVVTVSGRQILVDNVPYTIKGICYNPVPKGSESRNWSTLTQDLALMKEAGINTIRVYSPIDEEEVLDEISAAGIKVIVGFGYNMGGYYDILSGTYLDYIKKYKTHDAILLWEFGNEYNYHPEWFGNDMLNWYNALDDAANEAHLEDLNHPTATAHGELPDATARNTCPNIDVWGMNVYRWDNPSEIFNQWQSASSLPMYLAEAGGDRYMTATMNGYDEGENQQAQADATKNILKHIFDRPGICSGVTLFEFSDEWWKAGNPSVQDIGGWAPESGGVPYDGAPNEEYWGIVDIDRVKTLAFEEVKTKYNSILTGVNESNEQKSFIVYPVPSDNFITIGIESADLINQKYIISNLAGKIIDQGIIYTSSLQVHNLNTGLYNLQIISEASVLNTRFIIQ